MRLLIVFAALLLLISAGCNHGERTPSSSDPNVVQVDTDDAEMNQAIAEAQKTLPEFLSKLKANKDPNMYFSIKVRMATSGGNFEHIWVENLKKVNETRYGGTLANDPEFLEGMKFGSPVEFDLKDVSDWMIHHPDGKMEGGYTVKLLQGSD